MVSSFLQRKDRPANISYRRHNQLMLVPQKNRQVPEIERMAGIECYCTPGFEGTGGAIKQGAGGDFIVSELVDESVLDFAPRYGGAHRYPLYVLEKQGVDSNHALFEIERGHRLRLRVMGIKDARAFTRQYAGAQRAWENPPKELQTRHTKITLRGFTKRPIGKESLAGNEFTITVHGAQHAARMDEEFVPLIAEIANFYGLQRFGSERLVTHLVGRAIVKRDFAQAVHLLLTYTTEYDTESSREIRAKCSDPASYGQALRMMPRGMDIERQLLSALAAGRDAVSALRAVSITIRRLFVQAYQSYLFNLCLSRALAAGEDIAAPRPGDLCFEMEGPMTFGRIARFDPSSKKQQVPAVRMAGYTFQPGKGRFELLTKELLEQEGVVPRDFYIKEMQELSQQGGFRQAPLWCRDFTYRQEGGSALVVSFKLPKGSYATTLLRELVKPADPIRAGF
ncbi:MAG: tRNA pseudouridine(13) synthase TruD [Nitrososphaera sp.]